jgi:3-oxoacyl-[acyl-carrier protein] reductase
MSDPDAGAALAEVALGWTGRIDVLVNNAGHWGTMAVSAGSDFEAVEDWQSILRINTEGAIRLSRVTAPIMRERKWGRMVHISSTLAVGGAAGAEYYAAAKAARHGFSRSAAFSLGKDGDILTNVVILGLTRTATNTTITTRRATITVRWHRSDGYWTPRRPCPRSCTCPRPQTPESPDK